MNIATAYIITFIASFCTLVIEIVAGRILAPFVGVSLYTWTSIIGVVLAGISIGAFMGGKIADRFPDRRTLVALLLVAGCATLLIPPVTSLIASYRFPTSLMVRILLVTTIIFFIPSCILGMISPVVIKLAVRNLDKVGNVVGKIYAFSTLGSIIGTFAAGFFLISWMGTRHIILVMGLILILTAITWGALFRRKDAVITMAVLVPSFFFFGAYDRGYTPALTPDTLYFKESDYFTIKVKNATSSDGATPLKSLVLDNLVHSYVKPGDPLHIEYPYERIYGEVLRWRFGKDDAFRSLTIGGGGYTFPRYMEAYYPKTEIDVVEIDPAVTDVVYRFFGLPETTRIRSYNTDGRWFVMNTRNIYDVVFADAYNDLSIPYHLTTREFASILKDTMTPEGILMTNIIDNFQQGTFLPSYISTLREVFGRDNVHLIAISNRFDEIRISTFVVLAIKGGRDIGDFEAYLKSGREPGAIASVMPASVLEKFMKRTSSVVLRDDYAPVDNLIAPIFETRFGYNKRQQ